MFAVLILKERIPRGFLEKLWSRVAFHPPKARLEGSGSLSYLRITADLWPHRSPDWKAIVRLAAWAPGGLLLPDGLEAPEGLPLVDCFPFQLRLLKKAMQISLAMAALPPGKLCVGVVDPRGRYGRLIRKLLPFAREVRVLTERPERVENLRRRDGRVKYPALKAASGPDELSGCAVVADPEGVGPVLPGAVVFCAKPGGSCPDALTGYRVGLFPEVEALRPEGVDPMGFAGALYAAGRLPGRLEIQACISRTGSQSLPEVAQSIRNAAKAIRKGV